MLRSAVNAILQESDDFFRSMNFALPPFAHWTPDDWRGKTAASREIVECRLGWDITDFGMGDFAAFGLALFTIRNGVVGSGGKDYAEKAMIVKPSQITPTHYHAHKMEDIVVRGGGGLTLQLWNLAADGQLADTPVQVSVDGTLRTVAASEFLELGVGESVTLPPTLWHRFYGTPVTETTFVGEVSRVNDDHTDNVFFDPVGRFPDIEEDEEPWRFLVGDYDHYCPLV